MSAKLLSWSFFPVVLLAGGSAWALENGLARTPPMGWNSWNRFGGGIDEKLIRETIDAAAENGLRDAGYVNINIDDCWSRRDEKDRSGAVVRPGRDEKGDLVPDPKRFPGGIKALADYAHSKGMRLGIYSDAGTLTCAGYPGSAGHEVRDARLWASWGIDYLKYDWCNTTGQTQQEAYRKMSDALKACGRPIVFSLCEWGGSRPWTWAGPVGNLWRTTGDIGPNWDSILGILDQQVGLEFYAGPGHWNDPDMLEVGNGRLTLDENRAHFSLWCILAAPLLAGNDLRKMDKGVLAIITNKEVIAVNQDRLGIQGAKVWQRGNREVWAKPLAGGSQAVALLNRGTEPAEIVVPWSDLAWPAATTAGVRDLWAGKDLGLAQERFAARVPPHAVVMIRATPRVVPPANLPPAVKLIVNRGEPRPVYTLGKPGVIVRALPYAPDGRVVKVEILAGNEVLKTFAGGPYTVAVGKAGTWTYTAKATDDKGVSAGSQPLVVKVEQGDTAPRKR
jgi:alpha-galactosidase